MSRIPFVPISSHRVFPLFFSVVTSLQRWSRITQKIGQIVHHSQSYCGFFIQRVAGGWCILLLRSDFLIDRLSFNSQVVAEVPARSAIRLMVAHPDNVALCVSDSPAQHDAARAARWEDHTSFGSHRSVTAVHLNPKPLQVLTSPSLPHCAYRPCHTSCLPNPMNILTTLGSGSL